MKKRKFNLKVYSERCKECGICFQFCPAKNLKPGPDGTPEMVDPDKCTGCKMCEYMCPDFAIQIETSEPENRSEQAKGKEGQGVVHND